MYKIIGRHLKKVDPQDYNGGFLWDSTHFFNDSRFGCLNGGFLPKPNPTEICDWNQLRIRFWGQIQKILSTLVNIAGAKKANIETFINTFIISLCLFYSYCFSFLLQQFKCQTIVSWKCWFSSTKWSKIKGWGKRGKCWRASF